MKSDLRAGQIGGTLPILYVFLARSGKTIKSATPIALDPEGQVKTGNENPGPQRAARRPHYLRRRRRRREDAVLLLDRSLQRRREVERLPEILLDAGARQQP